MVKYFDATFAQIWLLDKERKRLVLRISAAKSKTHNDEFPKEQIMDFDIIVQTKKPAITNDITNDSRINHPEWAVRERLKSFAGYPLIHSNQVVGVLTLFSKKKINPADFELLGIFSNHISKQLSIFFDTLQLQLVKKLGSRN